MHATTCVNFPNSGESCSSRLQQRAERRSLRSHLDLCCLQFASLLLCGQTQDILLMSHYRKMWQLQISTKIRETQTDPMIQQWTKYFLKYPCYSDIIILTPPSWPWTRGAPLWNLLFQEVKKPPWTPQCWNPWKKEQKSWTRRSKLEKEGLFFGGGSGIVSYSTLCCSFFLGGGQQPCVKSVLNMEPENYGFQKESPFPGFDF